ncbi:hypothetical protein K458DRAFT_412898 [Lentithecium fluviatile CBS 122367]|uniref:Uncharacterized protein n=1 Tax=Lentithecium fluviatile CBS 122367 TaxID=1168545 RepID=A0A6G1JIL8_9PLEO|nr:hypothetical protein K458DRAFT_412898 [Lentithecium fluviatile CBS 122367]
MILARAIVLPFVLYDLFNFTTMLLKVPTVRLFKHAICVCISQRRDIDKAVCRNKEIQDLLSSVKGGI